MFPRVVAELEPASERSGRSAAISRPFIGLMLGSFVSLFAFQRGMLSGSGALISALMGFAVTARGGYLEATQLVGFFATSGVLSRLARTRNGRMCDVAAKGARRDAWQVIANGLLPTAIVSLVPSPSGRAAYLGAIAAVTGDTWATEIGTRFGRTPRNVLNLQPVEAGESGGITLSGTMASLVGGTLIGAVAAVGQALAGNQTAFARQLVAGAVSGVAGSLIDSIAGATIQERRYCRNCRKPTEQLIHRCGRETVVIGGIAGLTNDHVNLICSISGALIGWLLHAPRKSTRVEPARIP